MLEEKRPYIMAAILKVWLPGRDGLAEASPGKVRNLFLHCPSRLRLNGPPGRTQGGFAAGFEPHKTTKINGTPKSGAPLFLWLPGRDSNPRQGG
jgi:hypothetical protein